MFIIDEENLIIHDMSHLKYECHTKKIPDDKKRKVYTMDQVKRMVDTSHIPVYNGCRWCLADLHTFDMNSIFRRDH